MRVRPLQKEGPVTLLPIRPLPYSGGGPAVALYQMPVHEIGYVTSLVEAYEGIALVRTLDRARGILELWIMPEGEEPMRRLFDGLRRESPIQTLEAGRMD